jgi:hypothetical protein
MAIAAKLQIDERRSERRAIDVATTLRGSPTAPHDTLIIEISRTGCSFAETGDVAPGDISTLGLPGLGVRQARVVRCDEYHCACEFVTALTASNIDTLLAMPDTSPVSLPVGPRAARMDEAPRALPSWRGDRGDADDDADKLPLGYRFLLLIGASALLWGLIILGIWSAVALLS